MTQFIKIKATGGYCLLEGLEGVIVPLTDILGSLAVVHAPKFAPFCKREYLHLTRDKMITVDEPNNYFLNSALYEVVDNPFSHWNRLKSGELH